MVTSNLLCDLIVDDINHHGGAITFAHYMNLALYSPGLGYYRNHLPKFGKAGDFITAPEISPLFGHCLAQQCAPIIADIGAAKACILEFGAGTGKLALSILESLTECDLLPERYYIMEPSAVLKTRQQDYIQRHASSEWASRIEWLTELPKQPISGVIIANEVLDAMPVHKFQWGDSLQEIFVTYKANQLNWQLGAPESPRLTEYVCGLGIDFAPGYCSEVNLNIDGWIASLNYCLKKGQVVLIDYGFLRQEYYHPQRSQGTIVCHYQHKAYSDPLVRPGLQDITAHVDFSHVCDAAHACGFEVASYTNQARFLMKCGLLALAQSQMESMDAVGRCVINQQIKRLTWPTEMGELFKVLILNKRG